MERVKRKGGGGPKRQRGYTRVSPKHQVTLPADVLAKAGLKVGDRLQVAAGGAGEDRAHPGNGRPRDVCRDTSGRVSGRLPGRTAKRVGLTVLDAGVVIAFLDPADAHHAAAFAALRQARDRADDELVIPASAYAETLVGPFRNSSAAAAIFVDAFLDDLPAAVEVSDPSDRLASREAPRTSMASSPGCSGARHRDGRSGGSRTDHGPPMACGRHRRRRHLNDELARSLSISGSTSGLQRHAGDRDRRAVARVRQPVRQERRDRDVRHDSDGYRMVPSDSCTRRGRGTSPAGTRTGREPPRSLRTADGQRAGEADRARDDEMDRPTHDAPPLTVRRRWLHDRSTCERPSGPCMPASRPILRAMTEPRESCRPGQ